MPQVLGEVSHQPPTKNTWRLFSTAVCTAACVQKYLVWLNLLKQQMTNCSSSPSKTTIIFRVCQFTQKYGGWWRWALVSPDGVSPSRMVGVPPSVNLRLHHKSRSSLLALAHLGGPRKRAVKWLCVCQFTQPLHLTTSVAAWGDTAVCWLANSRWRLLKTK